MENDWAIFTQYPTMVISHGQFIFSKDNAISIGKSTKNENNFIMWIQKKNTTDRIYINMINNDNNHYHPARV